MSKLLSDAVDEYLVYRKMTYTAATAKQSGHAMRRFLILVGNVQTKSLGPQHAERFQSSLMHAGLKPASVNAYMNVLRSFSKWGLAHKYMAGPLGTTVRNVKVPPVPRLRVPVTEFERLLECAERPEDRMLVALGVYLFLRAGEATAITMADVDLDTGTIRAHIKKTNQFDEMPICFELDQELRRWLTIYAADHPLEPTSPLIPARLPFQSWLEVTGESIYSKDRPMGLPARRVQLTLARAGYDVRGDDGKSNREGVHTLRRSGARAYFDEMCASGSVRDNVLRHVMSMLHHASVVTTERYLGLEADREKRDLHLRGKRMFQQASRDNVVALNERREG